MKHFRFFLLNGLFLAALLVMGSCEKQQKNKEFIMWYEQPAKEWMEAVPLGNGRIGAMVYGGTENETIALNEVTMWSGQPDPAEDDICGKENLKKIRDLFFKGKIEEGNHLGTQHLSGHPRSFGTHLPVGDLKMRFSYPEGEITNYYRDLDLNNAMASVSFDKGGVKYSREYFCSNPDEVLVMKFMADKSGMISTELSFDMLRNSTISASEEGLTVNGDAQFDKQGPGGVKFSGIARIIPKGGKTSFTDTSVKVENADEDRKSVV